MHTVTIINPFSGATVEHDVTNVTDADTQAIAQTQDDATLYALEGAETPTEWIERFVAHVGPKAAGVAILGS